MFHEREQIAIAAHLVNLLGTAEPVRGKDALVEELEKEGFKKSALEVALMRMAEMGLLRVEEKTETETVARSIWDDAPDGVFLTPMPPRPEPRTIRYQIIRTLPRLREWLNDALTTTVSPSPGSPADTQRRLDAAARYTFGQLLNEIGQHEAAAKAFTSDPTRMSGIRQIEVFCDAEGTGFTVPTIRKLRARICQRQNVTPDVADSLSLHEAAIILKGNRLASFPEFQAQTYAALNDPVGNFIIDGITLAPGHSYEISTADCKIVPGTQPSLCPSADPPMRIDFLPEIWKAFQRFPDRCPKGHTIHWVGYRANIRDKCHCFDAHHDAATANTTVNLQDSGPTARETDTETPQESQIPALSQRQYEILEALYLLKAFDAEKRKTTREIVEKTEPGANSEAFKEPIADLKRRGLIETKEGRGGGWLTPVGLALVKQIK